MAARYATAVTRLDYAIGDIMRHLVRLGIDRDTMIIFTSDNGPADEYGADPRTFASAGPFDGFKRDVFEGGIECRRLCAGRRRSRPALWRTRLRSRTPG